MNAVHLANPAALAYEATPARLVAGALAHLARHMETGCLRSASLAVILLERLATDPDADDHLRRHACELVEILDRDDGRRSPTDQPNRTPPAPGRHGFSLGVL